VQAKQDAYGTSAYQTAVNACSTAIMKEYTYCFQVRRMLVGARRGSKQWWNLSRELFSQQAKIENIPALKSGDGCWVYEPGSKSEILAECFGGKSILPGPVVNEYTVECSPYRQKSLRELKVENVLYILTWTRIAQLVQICYRQEF
jgi:hypothetical protein